MRVIQSLYPFTMLGRRDRGERVRMVKHSSVCYCLLCLGKNKKIKIIFLVL